MTYQFKLHDSREDTQPAILGLVFGAAGFYADNGFGEYITVNFSLVLHNVTGADLDL